MIQGLLGRAFSRVVCGGLRLLGRGVTSYRARGVTMAIGLYSRA